MKLIVAIIRPEKLDAVQAALESHEVGLVSVSQVLGDGREPGYTEVYRGREVRVRRPKLRLEVVADDMLVEDVVQALVRAAAPGGAWQSGDGQVFVLPVEASFRICEREHEPAANETGNARRWATSLLKR